MNKFNKIALISLSVFALSSLTACGGGGGDEGGGGTGGDVVMGQNGAVDVNSQGSFAISMLAAVNTARATGRNCGSTHYPAVPPLSWNALLTESAAWYANDMATKNYFNPDHSSSDGRQPYDRIIDTGYKASNTGENIGAGQTSVNQVMNQWLASSGHCSAIMSPYFKEMGAARVSKSGTSYGNYWVQNFGAP